MYATGLVIAVVVLGAALICIAIRNGTLACKRREKDVACSDEV
jgi:hypothetical protein